MLSPRNLTLSPGSGFCRYLRNSGSLTAGSTDWGSSSLPRVGVGEACNPQKVSHGSMPATHPEKPIKIIAYLEQRSKSRTLTALSAGEDRKQQMLTDY